MQSATLLLEAARLGHAAAQVDLAAHLEAGAGVIAPDTNPNLNPNPNPNPSPHPNPNPNQVIAPDSASAALWYAAGAREAGDGGAALRRWGVLLAQGGRG